MKSLLVAAALLTAVPVAAFAPAAFAQGAPQTLVGLNVSNVASGYRASKIVGSAIVNEANDKVGTIDDLIVSRSDRVPYAIISVGGFLGMGDKLVAVPMANLQFSMDRTLFSGATKDMLKSLPAFTYQK